MKMPFASHAGKSVSKLTASCPPKIRALPPQRLHRGNPVFQSLVHYIPIHIGEEGVDVARRCGSEIHLVCMLIHVEDQERHCCCKCLGVVAGPSGSQLSGQEFEAEDCPAAAAAEAVAGRAKMLFPGR